MPDPVTITMGLATFIQPLIGVANIGIATLLTTYVPKALAAFTAHTGTILTDQQRAMVLGAVKTAAGTIETLIDQTDLHVTDVTTANEHVRKQADKVIANAPDAAKKLGLDHEKIAEMIVGAVDTKGRTTKHRPTSPNRPSGRNGVHHTPDHAPRH
jgi:Asp-tRNA(Asn)/Glu-tRNA(Gln) amidotransferase B subunit